MRRALSGVIFVNSSDKPNKKNQLEKLKNLGFSGASVRNKFNKNKQV